MSKSHFRAADLVGESPATLSASSRFSAAALSRQIESKLIEAYFENYHVVYPFVHEPTFRAQYHEIISRPVSASWKLLLSTVLALGSWSSGQTQTELDEQLYRRSTSLGEDESIFEVANLTTIQALVLLSNLAQKRNRPNTGWNMLGLATRMALSLGLHREHPSWSIGILHQEMRRRVWWGLFLFDSGASTTFGRPILLPDHNSMDTQHILNIDDEVQLSSNRQEFTNPSQDLTPKTSIQPPESPNPTIYSSMKAQSAFHVESNYISNRLLLHGFVSPVDALLMNATLDTWAANLPGYFQLNQLPQHSESWYTFARARLHWRLWNFKIILLRQILMRQVMKSGGEGLPNTPVSEAEKCSRICLQAAHLTISSIDDYLRHSERTKLVLWYST